MTNPQKAIIPGIIFGCLMLILFTRFLTSAQVANAATQVPEQSAVSNAENKSKTCLLTTLPESIHSWCSLIDQSSRKYGVSPKLIAAVMLQESGGQSDVISSSGAVGLMQVMPHDGIASSFMCANGPCFSTRPSTRELLDPEFNIDYGVRMLSNLLAKYGNEREALKSYGPYNVDYYYADKVLAIKTGF